MVGEPKNVAKPLEMWFCPAALSDWILIGRGEPDTL
jgi:hypothetical protein